MRSSTSDSIYLFYRIDVVNRQPEDKWLKSFSAIFGLPLPIYSPPSPLIPPDDAKVNKRETLCLKLAFASVNLTFQITVTHNK